MKKGDLVLAADIVTRYPARTHRVQATGEFRAPRAQEWYISGAIPEGYYAENDLSTPYHIGRLVRVRVREVIEVLQFEPGFPLPKP